MQAHDDDDDAGQNRKLRRPGADQASDEARTGAERHEHGGKTQHERHGCDHHRAPRRRFALVIGDMLDGGAGQIDPRFKEAFTLNYRQAMLVQLAFFGAYSIGGLVDYLISMFYGDPINRIGYKRGVLIGVLIGAVGSALFYPAAMMTSYPFFLAALFIVGLGLAMLQIAANPYVTILGPERTASSRLNLS